MKLSFSFYDQTKCLKYKMAAAAITEDYKISHNSKTLQVREFF